LDSNRWLWRRLDVNGVHRQRCPARGVWPGLRPSL